MQLFELESGKYFVASHEPNRVYIKTRDGDENHEYARCVAAYWPNEPNDHKWKFIDYTEENWNPYCEVKEVKLLEYINSIKPH